MEQKSGFGSKFGHIMTLAGFCIGISNMWKFPYMVGANGGGAFLIIYLICVVLVGLPLFILEQQLGRAAQAPCATGIVKMGGGKGWAFGAGWLGVITVLMIGCYFWTIMGWNVGYIFKTASGSLYGLSNEAIVDAFGEFSGSWGCVLCSAICAALAWFMLNTGFKKGVEKLCSVALPALMVMLVGLAIYSNTLPGSGAGLKWYLVPDFANCNIGMAFEAAVVQVFFSVGVGMACAFVYGSYMSPTDNLCQDSVLAVACDTFVATMSGMVITPALFAFGIEPAAGPSLIFISLPQMFTAMGNATGRIFGVIFLICVFLACLTSIVGVLEAGVACFTAKWGWSRFKANNIVTIGTFAISILVTRNMGSGPLGGKTFLFGFGLFDTLDTLASGFGLTFTALFMLLFVLIKYGYNNLMEGANMGATGKVLRLRPWMKWYYTIPLPIILVAVIYCILHFTYALI